MKYMLVENFHDSIFGNHAPVLGRLRSINSRIETRPRAASERAVRIE